MRRTPEVEGDEKVTVTYACDRQYNLDVYEHGLGRHRYCRCVRAVCIVCRARRDSFDSIRAQGCFLPYAPGIYGNRLAMVDRGVRPACVFSRFGNIWENGCESNFSAAAHANCNAYFDSASYRDSNFLANHYEYTHCDSDAQWDSDCFSRAFTNAYLY